MAFLGIARAYMASALHRYHVRVAGTQLLGLVLVLAVLTILKTPYRKAPTCLLYLCIPIVTLVTPHWLWCILAFELLVLHPKPVDVGGPPIRDRTVCIMYLCVLGSLLQSAC